MSILKIYSNQLSSICSHYLAIHQRFFIQDENHQAISLIESGQLVIID